MRRVVQQNDWSCLACCAVMVTGEPLAALVADVGHDGGDIIPHSRHSDGRRGFTLCEIIRYLAGRGYTLGACLEQMVSITDPAILMVKGRRFNHAIFWDGEEVHDPSPAADDNRQLMDYTILQWWPVARVI